MSKANVAFDDHPNDKRFADRIETVTADSVFAWLRLAPGATGLFVAAALLAAVLAALAVYRWFEKPMTKVLRRLLRA